MTKKLTISSMLAAFAIILSYIESIIPFSIGIPGVKLGLANLVIVIVIYNIGAREAAAINFVRIIITGAMFGNLFSIVYSLAGAVCSLAVMLLLKKVRFFSIVSVSVAGGVSHNIGQLIAAIFIVNTYSIIYYIPLLMISGIITGGVIGILADIIGRRTYDILHKR
ncbi:MAG: Gx transporter family protein [Eubacterium sp.]